MSLEKIRKFEEANTPVDSYGVGQRQCLSLSSFFSADAVLLNGKNEAKDGLECIVQIVNWLTITN